MLAIGFDADDTLWHNESLYALTQGKFRELLAPYGDAAWIDQQLYATETRNLAHFGYGIKGFTLSMIETAHELCSPAVSSVLLGAILEAGRELLLHRVELLPGVEGAIEELADLGELVLVTKGDLRHQEAKFAASGLGRQPRRRRACVSALQFGDE